MKVILAEKPSVAREIAAVVGANQRQEGYLAGGGYQVTWAYGHLVTLKEPGDYDPALKKWSLETLPIIPARFELKLIGDARSRQQFALVKRLFRAAEEIICATDAGREGELIFRYILQLAGCQGKPIRRLWLSSLTPTAIRQAMNRLRPGRDFDRLYAAARCRSEADWIVGLNATRSHTVRHGPDNLLWSVGRVQTPVLALIVQRDDEIRTFQPQPFWELLTEYRDVTFKYRGDRFPQQSQAEQLLDRVKGTTFTVTVVQRKQQRLQPPQLYDLTELQREMNRRYGSSADATLKAAQALYESKLISYPRTDSRYLSSDMKPQVPGILERLQPIRAAELQPLDLNALRFSARIVNDRKVTDHHAIIPTGNVPNRLPAAQQRVFDAIVTRLIAAFYPACLKEITSVNGVAGGVEFQARGVRVIEPGWTILDPRAANDDGQQLPALVVGESGPHQPSVKAGETSPPKHFTENTLLGVMETAGRLVDDEQLKEALKEKGLGTPATRASIIETLLDRGYIERSGKQLLATDPGRYLIAIIDDPHLKSAELTGGWEAKLRAIETGGLDPRQFMKEIAEFTEHVVHDNAGQRVDQQRLGECPRCGRAVIQGKKGFGCSGWRDGCAFVLWPTYKDFPLSVMQIRELLQLRTMQQPIELPGSGSIILRMSDSGQLMEIPVPRAAPSRGGSGPRGRSAKGKPRRAGRKSATGRPTRSTAAGESTNAGKAKGQEDPSLGACPVCGADVNEQKKSFSCSRWREGCGFVIWKTIAGKRISVRTARTLIAKGESAILKGFRSKAGRSFEARLKLDDGQVRLDFER